MRINSILFNFLLLIFLGILIYLYLYINYGTYEGFEDPVDDRNSQTFQIDSDNTDNTNAIKIADANIVLERDGSMPELAAKSGVYITYINDFKNPDGKNTNPIFGNGYYWINLPVVGPKYIYCITDNSYNRGGWMLAMRSIYGSKTFNYSSKHWTHNSTLNASSAEIKQLLPTLLGRREGNRLNPLQNFDPSDINNNYKEKFNISSVGENLYFDNKDGYIPNINDFNNFDCKLDTFNYFRASEIMIIFYFIDIAIDRVRAPNFIGGDISEKKGWIWRDTISPINDVQPTLLELFQYLDNNNIVRQKSGNLKNSSKFKKPNNDNSIMWVSTDTSDNPLNFYGFNLKSGKVGVRIGFSFGKKDKNNINITAVNGIGLSYNGNSDDFSAGRVINSTAIIDRESSKEYKLDYENMINAINSSPITIKPFDSFPFSFELYVR